MYDLFAVCSSKGGVSCLWPVKCADRQGKEGGVGGAVPPR